MKICIDGNDGTGKTTLVKSLTEEFPEHEFSDRGLPTAMTVGKIHSFADMYIILDCSVELSLQRLERAGKDMTEHWHLPKTLNYYKAAFLDLAVENNWYIINTSKSIERTLANAKDLIKK